MNDVCKSIGDCGLEFNIAGKYTKNFQVVNTTENISASALEKLRSLINPIQGKFLSPQDLTYFMLLASSLKSNTGTNMPEETGPGLSISGRSDKDKSKETSKYVDWVAPLGVAALVTGFSSTYDSMYDNTNRYYDSEYGRDARHTGSLWDSFDNHGQWGEDATAKAKTGGNKYAYNLFDGFGKTAIGAYGGWYGGGYLSKVSGFKEGSTSDYMMKAGASLFLGSIFNDGTDAFTKGLWGASGNFENEREWGYSDSLDGDPNYGSQGDAQGNFWTSTPMLGLYAMALSYVFDEDEDDGEECRTQTITTHRAVFFECKPWSPPVGGADCEKCNNDETRPCSEYRCSSLGAGCEIVNKGTNNEICVNNASNDITPPEIKETMDLDKRIRYSRRGKDIEISGRSGGCLDAFNPYLIGIKTNEPAECKYSFKPKEKFEELEYSLGSGYVYNHISQIRMPNPSLVQNWDGKIAMYVKCRDVQGNPSPPGYEFFKIAMCVNSANDLIPPVILTIPSNGTYVRKNATQIGIRVYTNEPAECRWSAEDKQYDLMENNISCLNQPAEITLLGYLCGAVMNTNANKNTIYIRCKDQPQFAGKNESKRMANFQSKELTLLKAESPLDILSIAPNSDFETTTLVNLVALKALTSGGAGDVLCSYSFTGYENMILFKDNNGDEHEQVFDGGLTPGNYKIYIKCEDITGDFAVREARFNIIYDANPTEIARIFTESDALKLLTLKDRECKYSTDNEVKCSFNFNLGRAIGIGKTHTIEFEKGKINYVKCANKFGEVPEGCTIIVKVI
jgi:hypothetical protein